MASLLLTFALAAVMAGFELMSAPFVAGLAFLVATNLVLALFTIFGDDDFSRRAGRFLGDNRAFGVASVLLLAVSGYATWSGMSDFILGLEGQDDAQTRAVVVAIVVVLTFLMWLSLREVVGRRRRLMHRLVMAPLYILLALWSIGFGYGYWWSLIAGQTATVEGLRGQEEDVRDAASDIRARLAAVGVQLNSVVRFSEQQMAQEEARGGSCGIASGAGRGPLWTARRNARDSVDGLNADIRNNWLGSIEADLVTLGESVAQFSADGGGTVEERQKNFETAAAQVRDRARTIAAKSNELGRSFGANMRQLAAGLSVPPGESAFSCFDPRLAQLLRDTAEAAERPVGIQLREAGFSEGAAGVARAVFAMWGFIGDEVGGFFQWLGSLIGLSEAPPPAAGAAAGEDAPTQPIGGRDLIALLATVAVDLGLLVLTLVNPPPPPLTLSRPSADVKNEILQAIRNVMRRTGKPLDWIRLHFIHHRDTSYFIVPNYYAVGDDHSGAQKDVSPEDDADRINAHALNQLAGVLDDIKIVEALSTRELQRAQKEERRASWSQIRRPETIKADEAGLEDYVREREKVIRNHGVLSKARRTLQNAGWRGEPCADFEVYRLVDEEGLTPLLDILSDSGLDTDSYQPSDAGRPAEAEAEPAPSQPSGGV